MHVSYKCSANPGMHEIVAISGLFWHLQSTITLERCVCLYNSIEALDTLETTIYERLYTYVFYA